MAHRTIRLLLLIVVSFFSLENSYSQFGKITFNELEYSYHFSDSTFNTTVYVDGGIILNTDIGQIRFQIPFSPIEEAVNINFLNYLENNSTAFEYGGLMDGEYDFEKEGSYTVIGRGLMKVNKSNVGRGYPANTSLKIIGSIVFIEISISLKLEDYGIDIDRIHQKVIVDEINVKISGSARLE